MVKEMIKGLTKHVGHDQMEDGKVCRESQSSGSPFKPSPEARTAARPVGGSPERLSF